MIWALFYELRTQYETASAATAWDAFFNIYLIGYLLLLSGEAIITQYQIQKL